MTRTVRSVAALVVLLALGLPATAATLPDATATVGAPFALRLGGEAVIEGMDVRVRFDRVTDDSRCPIDVVCVWAGVFRMVLVVESQAGATPSETEIVLDTMGGEGDAAGLHFTLIGVKPSRFSYMGPTDPQPYTVLIRADRLQ